MVKGTAETGDIASHGVQKIHFSQYLKDEEEEVTKLGKGFQ